MNNLYVRLVLALISLGLNILGYYIIVNHFGWTIALGFFLLFWGENIANRVYYEKKEYDDD